MLSVIELSKQKIRISNLLRFLACTMHVLSNHKIKNLIIFPVSTILSFIRLPQMIIVQISHSYSDEIIFALFAIQKIKVIQSAAKRR